MLPQDFPNFFCGLWRTLLSVGQRVQNDFQSSRYTMKHSGASHQHVEIKAQPFHSQELGVPPKLLNWRRWEENSHDATPTVVAVRYMSWKLSILFWVALQIFSFIYLFFWTKISMNLAKCSTNVHSKVSKNHVEKTTWSSKKLPVSHS